MQDLSTQRPRRVLFLIVSYTLWASVTLRWVTEFIEEEHPLTYLLSGMLLLFGVLLGLEPRFTRGSGLRAHLYLAFQTALVFIATLLYYELDFFAILYLPLCGQAVFLFPRRAASAWVFILVMATSIGQTIQFGWPEAIPFILLYSGGQVFVAAFSILTLQAEAARARSEKLLSELQETHKKLQEYADQAEELAVGRERNRLARDLHDSVAQALYGLTLQFEAASRRLTAGQLDAVEDYLNAMRHSTQQTLGEMRLLIFELRPPILDNGLAAALKTRLEAVEERSGLLTRLDTDDVQHLPDSVENGLYRIAQEALNNVLKHASAKQVNVSLSQERGKIILEITDDGVGFDLDLTPEGGSMGLQSMQERAQELGGLLILHSSPGQGSLVRAEVPV